MHFKCKSLLGFVLTILMVLPMPILVGADSESVRPASASYGEDTFSYRLKTWHATSDVPIVKEQRGREGWLLEPSKGTLNRYIYVDVDRNYLYDLKEEAVEITVDYFDEGKGTFLIEYDARDRVDQHTEIVDLTNTRQWKSYTFFIQDACFLNRLEKADFRIGVYSTNMGNSRSAVLIGGVSVQAAKEKSPVHIKLTTPNTGNIFFEGDPIDFSVNLINKTEAAYELFAVYQAIDGEKNVMWSQEEKLLLKGEEELTRELTFEADRFGLHWLRVELFDEAGTVYCIRDAEFSYVTSNRGARLNRQAGTSTHTLNHLKKYGDDGQLSYLMQQAGYGYTRDEWLWNWFEQEVDSFAVSPQMKNNMLLYKEKDINKIYVLSISNPLFPGHTKDPSFAGYENPSDYFMERLEKYVAESVKATKNYCNTYIIGNEYDHPEKTAETKKPETYVQYMKVVYETVKKYHPEATVLGVAATATDVSWIEEVFRLGGGQYMDAITLHPYANTQTLEESDFVGRLQAIKDIAAEYGYEDFPLWITELGWTSRRKHLMSEWDQSQLFVKAHIYGVGRGLVECLVDYQMPGSDANTQYSGGFGTIRPSNLTGAGDVDLPNGAERTYLTMAAWNKNFGGDSTLENYMEDGSLRAYQFRRHSDGKRFVAMWTTEERENISLSLGTESLFVMDILGNEQEMVSESGVYTFNLSHDITYAIGDFTDFKQTESVFEADALSKLCIRGQTTELRLQLPPGLGAEELEVVGYGDARVVSITDTAPGQVSLELSLQEEQPQRADRYLHGLPGTSQYLLMPLSEPTDYVRIALRKEGRLYGNLVVPLREQDEVEISCKVVPYSLDYVDRWRAVVSLTNNGTEEAQGELTFTSPTTLSENLSAVPVTLAPLETKEVVVHIPQKAKAGQLNLVAEFNRSEKIPTEFAGNYDLCCGVYTAVPPTIDGTIDDGEWEESASIFLGGESMAVKLTENYGGLKDLSGRVYVMWDKENLYFGAKVEDNVHYQDRTGGGVWRGDSFQIGIAHDATKVDSPDSQYESYTHIMLAMNNEGVTTVHRMHGEDSSLKKADIERAEMVVLRQDTTTVYEAKIPWDEILPLEHLVEVGDGVNASGILSDNENKRKVVSADSYIAFSVLLNDNDGVERKQYLEYGSGIGGSPTSASVFKKLYLLGRE